MRMRPTSDEHVLGKSELTAWGPLHARDLRAIARGWYPESLVSESGESFDASDQVQVIDMSKPKLGRFPWKWRLLAAGMLLLGILNTYLSSHSPNPAPRSLNSNAAAPAVSSQVPH